MARAPWADLGTLEEPARSVLILCNCGLLAVGGTCCG